MMMSTWFHKKKVISQKMIKPEQGTKLSNQSFTSISTVLIKQMCKYMPDSLYILEKDVFSSCHERGTKKKFWIPMRDRTSDLQIPHSDALTTKPQRLHRERGWSSYDTRPVYCSDQQCRKRNVCRYVDIYKHYTFDIADRHCCSLQDVCHMNFVIDLAHRGVSVAQWLEHRSAESEGVRLDSSWRLFFVVPRSWQDEKTSFSISLPSSKLTISLISIYQLIHCKHKTNTWWFLSKGIAMVYNRWYSRWCCEKIDIWKSYPNVLSNNSQPIQLHSIHDAIEPFICKNYLRQRREFYID